STSVPNPVCAGSNVTFTAAITNGGANPAFLWRKNNIIVGTNSPTYTDQALDNGDQVLCEITSNAVCITTAVATSNTVTIVVNPVVSPAVSITAAHNDTACQGLPTIFSAIATNGGTNPSYQWRKNGINVGTNSATYTDNTLVNGDIITCQMASSL